MAMAGHLPRPHARAIEPRQARASSTNPRQAGTAPAGSEGLADLAAIVAADRILVGILSAPGKSARAPAWIYRLLLVAAECDLPKTPDACSSPKATPGPTSASPSARPSFGISHRHHRRLPARAVVLVVTQLRRRCAALHHLLRVDSQARARAASSSWCSASGSPQGRDRDRADARGLDAHHLRRRQGARSRRREAVLFARRRRAGRCSASSSVPFCLPWIISVLRVNIGLALDRRHRRRVHCLPAWPPDVSLRRPDLRHRAGVARRRPACRSGNMGRKCPRAEEQDRRRSLS